LINELKKELNIAVILITHDLGVVAETADRVVVMYAGEKLEEAPVRELFKNPNIHILGDFKIAAKTGYENWRKAGFNSRNTARFA